MEGLGVINPSGRPSCREEGDKWEKRSLPHHREDHDHHDCHDHHLDIEDDKILRKGKGVLIIQTFFKLKPIYVHN